VPQAMQHAASCRQIPQSPIPISPRKIRHICFEAGAYGTIKQHRAHVRLADRGIPTSNRRRGNNRGMSPYLVEALMRMSR
jgi:hypothetical protein